MIRKLFALSLGVLIVGCANTQETLPRLPKAIPTAWAQQPAEKGSLPVGRVIAIERYYGHEVKIAQRHEPQLRDALIPVVITAGLLAGPVIMALSEIGVDPLELHKPGDGGGNVYRHSIRLQGTDDLAVRDEFWSYRMGDCVALRSNPEMLVPALPGECE
jgi:hypothetical protein